MEDEGFVIKKKEYSDYDIFGSFYTNNLGKINLLIKNARKSKKRFMGKLEPFNLVSLKFKYKNQGSYPNLIESIDLIDNHNYITLDKKIIVLSSLINEYIDNFETLENPSKKNQKYSFYEISTGKRYENHKIFSISVLFGRAVTRKPTFLFFTKTENYIDRGHENILFS